MTLLLSTRYGYRLLGLLGLIKALLITWLLPGAIAAIALGAQKLLNTPALGDGFLLLWASTYLLMMSPVLSWLGLLLAAPLVVVLLNRGWFGWIPALALGIACGAVTAYLMHHELAISFGAALLLILRAVIGRLCPAAFTAEPPIETTTFTG